MFKINNQEINFLFGNSKPKIMLNNIQVYPQAVKTMNIFAKKTDAGGGMWLALTNDRTEYENDFIQSAFPYDASGGTWEVPLSPEQYREYTKIAEINYENFVGIHLEAGGTSYGDVYTPPNITFNNETIRPIYAEVGGFGTMWFILALPDDIPIASNLYIEFPPSN